jgi:hypothetical protein
MTSRVRRVALFVGIFIGAAISCAQDPTQTLTVTTRLVVLDATVLDKAGHIVTQPLGRDDFQIEENKRPQTVYSFESSAEHTSAIASGDAEKSPILIFVLDELNDSYEGGKSVGGNEMQQLGDETYERNELTAFVKTQPEKLNAPTEVLELTHHGYRIVVQPTQDRSLLLERLKKHNPGLGSPYRDYLEETAGDYTLSRASMQAITR